MSGLAPQGLPNPGYSTSKRGDLSFPSMTDHGLSSPVDFCQGREATEGKPVMEEGSSAYMAWDLRSYLEWVKLPVETVCRFPDQIPQGLFCSEEASLER